MTSTLISSLAFGQIILVQYVESTLFALGIIGSLLNILLFSQRKLRSNSCCIYFAASSLAALILLLMGISPQLYALNHTPDPLFNRNFCRARGYIGQFSAMLCRWLLTSACIDRCLLTSTNARLRLFSTVRIAQKIVILLLIIWLILPIHMLIFLDVRRIGYTICLMNTESAAMYNTIYTIILGGLIPPLIMLICTRKIWESLQLKRQRGGLIHSNRQDTKRENRDIQVLIMLLLQILIYILFTLPYMSFNLYSVFTRTILNKSTDRLAIESFMQLFTEITVFIHPALSFYSNTLVSQTFRHEFINLFWTISTCGHGQRRQRIAPTTITITNYRRNDLPMVDIN